MWIKFVLQPLGRVPCAEEIGGRADCHWTPAPRMNHWNSLVLTGSRSGPQSYREAKDYVTR